MAQDHDENTEQSSGPKYNEPITKNLRRYYINIWDGPVTWFRGKYNYIFYKQGLNLLIPFLNLS